jgi:hypothetical protein
MESRENDLLFIKGLKRELSNLETAGLLRRISVNERFRELFGDWVRVFRDPGLAASKKIKQRSP